MIKAFFNIKGISLQIRLIVLFLALLIIFKCSWLSSYSKSKETTMQIVESLSERS
ncbi:hypothetical protein KHA80_17220 [Anaerobacillus sp. HL2]|nr:hypothetical protein KHA80_17220 [Anaerobacillus sp. HL2]